MGSGVGGKWGCGTVQLGGGERGRGGDRARTTYSVSWNNALLITVLQNAILVLK